jgi:hypothetical protein
MHGITIFADAELQVSVRSTNGGLVTDQVATGRDNVCGGASGGGDRDRDGASGGLFAFVHRIDEHAIAVATLRLALHRKF